MYPLKPCIPQTLKALNICSVSVILTTGTTPGVLSERIDLKSSYTMNHMIGCLWEYTVLRMPRT